MQSLGITYKQKLLQTDKQQILYKGQKINHLLSKNEQKILLLLLKKDNSLVSYDEIADSLWGISNFKSLWAINKTIHRLKTKLICLGFMAKNCLIT